MRKIHTPFIVLILVVALAAGAAIFAAGPCTPKTAVSEPVEP